MKYQGGDVVLIDYTFSDARGSKVRPALVVRGDSRNQILTNTILAMITKNLARTGHDPTQLLVDISTTEGQLSGLNVNSAVTCGSLFTVHEDRISRKIGYLPKVLMLQIAVGLKAALDVP